MLKRNDCSHCNALFINRVANEGEAPEEALFIDQAVYTRNRAFRLILSSKARKSTLLQNTKRFGGQDLTDRQAFFACLACNVPKGSNLICVEHLTPPSHFAKSNTRKGYGSRARDGKASPFPYVEAYIAAFASSRVCPQASLVLFFSFCCIAFSLRSGFFVTGRPRGMGTHLDIL